MMWMWLIAGTLWVVNMATYPSNYCEKAIVATICFGMSRIEAHQLRKNTP